MNVLIVDDQPEVVQGMVSGVNWQLLLIDRVFLAYSVKEAKKIFEKETIDILLCDIEMPPTNGFELLRWAQERQPDIASIFLSAHAEFEYAQEAVKLGSFDYILQPAPYEEIEAAVSSAIVKIKKTEKLKQYMRENRQKGEFSAEPEHEASQDRMPVQKAIDYIRSHLDKELSRTEIAEAVFLNPEYLSHVFRKKTGKSLSEFIIAEKMQVAQSLLAQTNTQISSVASQVGYSNFSYFSQVFKKHTGISPMEYRARQQAAKTGFQAETEAAQRL